MVWHYAGRHVEDVPSVCVQMKLSNQQMPAEEENVTAYASLCCCLFMQVPSRPQLCPTPHVSAVSGLSKRNQLQRQLRAPSMRLITHN